MSAIMPTERGSFAYFTITSSRTLRDIEAYMGVAGDGRCWSIGDPRPNKITIYDYSRWSMLSGVEHGRPIEEHLRSLWRRMSDIRELISQLPKDMNRSVACVGHFNSHFDQFEISSGHFATAAYYHAKLDCDFYFSDAFGDEEEGIPYWAW